MMATTDQQQELQPSSHVVQHQRPFKLQFAAQREPGRSDVSLVKPRGMPSIVTGKCYGRAVELPSTPCMEVTEVDALRRVRDAYCKGPRDTHNYPQLTSHEVGWWSGCAEWQSSPRPELMKHHIRDSHWLRERLRVLTADKQIRS